MLKSLLQLEAPPHHHTPALPVPPEHNPRTAVSPPSTAFSLPPPLIIPCAPSGSPITPLSPDPQPTHLHPAPPLLQLSVTPSFSPRDLRVTIRLGQNCPHTNNPDSPCPHCRSLLRYPMNKRIPMRIEWFRHSILPGLSQRISQAAHSPVLLPPPFLPAINCPHGFLDTSESNSPNSSLPSAPASTIPASTLIPASTKKILHQLTTTSLDTATTPLIEPNNPPRKLHHSHPAACTPWAGQPVPHHQTSSLHPQPPLPARTPPSPNPHLTSQHLSLIQPA